MKEDNFKKILKQKLEGHFIVPPPNLMFKIERKLDNTNNITPRIHKKRSIFLWSSAIVAASVFIIIGVLKSNESLDEMILADVNTQIDAMENQELKSDDSVGLIELKKIIKPVEITKSITVNSVASLINNNIVNENIDVENIDVENNINNTIINVSHIEQEEPQEELQEELQEEPQEEPQATVKSKQNITKKRGSNKKFRVPQTLNNHIGKKKSKRIFVNVSTNGSASGTSYVKQNSTLAAKSFVLNESVGVPTYNSTIPVVVQFVTSPDDLKHNFPINISANVGFDITDRLSIESGITYSKLTSEAEINGRTGKEYNFKQTLNYLGIPVAIRYKLWKKEMFNVYMKTGATVEYAVSAKNNSNIPGDHSSESFSVKGVQPSIHLSAGSEFNFLSNLGFYIEPGIGYYFDTKQPESYRTHNQLNFNLSIGLRYSFN